MTTENYLKAVAIKEHITDLSTLKECIQNGDLLVVVTGYGNEEIRELLDIQEVENFLIKDCETKILSLEEQFKNL